MRRYILAPEAALDLVQIWRHLKTRASVELADRIETAIRQKIVFLSRTPGALRADVALLNARTLAG
jgi:plasmid stabilization system protein ParE